MTIYQVISIIFGIIIFATLESSCSGYMIYFIVYFVGNFYTFIVFLFLLKNKILKIILFFLSFNTKIFNKQ